MVLSAHYTLPDYEKQSLAKASQVRGKPQGTKTALLITEAPVPVCWVLLSNYIPTAKEQLRSRCETTNKLLNLI